GRRTRRGDAGALPLLVRSLLERGAHEVWQVENLDEDIERVFLRHGDLEVVLARAGVRGRLAGATAAGLRFLDRIARREFLVARQHEVALAAGAWIQPKSRLRRALGRDLDLPLLADIGDRGILQRLLNRLADLRTRPAQEALPVGETLALGVQAAVDEVGHTTPPC